VILVSIQEAQKQTTASARISGNGQVPLCASASERSLPVDQFVTECLKIRGLVLSAEQREAVVQQYTTLLQGGSGYSVRHVFGWTFPDGEYFPSQYLVFSSGNVDFGLARLSHGKLTSVERNIYDAPFCVIELIQGVLGVDSRKLPLAGETCRTILVHLLQSCAPVVRTAWTVALLRRTSNERLLDPFFAAHFVKADEYATNCWGNCTGLNCFHILNAPHKNRGVRKVLGFRPREHATSPYVGMKPISA
jgi:hypothetical protein